MVIINKEDALKVIEHSSDWAKGVEGIINFWPQAVQIKDNIVRIIKALSGPEIADEVHARWVKHWCDNNMLGHEYEECSNCGASMLDTNQFWDCKRCPNCGAIMHTTVKVTQVTSANKLTCSCRFGNPELRHSSEGGWYVICEHCGDFTEGYATEQEAIDAWNRLVGEGEKG